MQMFQCRLLTAAVRIRSIVDVVVHKPWYAMTGSQVHGTSSPMNSRCHMYHHCKQQAHFDQKRFWQMDRFRQWTWHGTTLYGQVTQTALTLVLCVFWTLADPSNATTKAFQLSDVSVWSPLNSVKCSILNQMPICDSRACCGQTRICWPPATNTA